LNWIELRGIKLVNCFVGDDCIEFPSNLITSKIKFIEISLLAETTLCKREIIDIIQLCPNLKIVSIMSMDTVLLDFFGGLNETFRNQIELFKVTVLNSDCCWKPIRYIDLDKSSFSVFQVMSRYDKSNRHLAHQFLSKTGHYSSLDHLISITDAYSIATIIIHQTTIPVDLPTITECLKSHDNLVLFEILEKELSIFSFTKFSPCKVILNTEPTFLHITEKNVLDFFTLCKGFEVILIKNCAFLSNNMLKVMIENSPHCEYRKYIDCGTNYDQKFVDEWKIV
jgi:hypothetical protein